MDFPRPFLLFVTRLLQRLLCPAAWIGLGALAGSPAIAQDDRSYLVIWMITPDTPPSTEVLSVKSYTSLASAKLLPPKLFVLAADVVGADNALILPAGTKLIGLQSRTMLACTMEAPPSQGLAAVWFLGVDRYVCFIDDDRDGKFDRYFRRGAAPVGILIGMGRIPKKTAAITPVPFEAADPATLADPPRIYVQYGWFASLVNELIFQACLAPNAVTGKCLSPDARVKRTALPATFSMFGATFSVVGRDEAGTQVRMDTPFEPRPLVIY